MKKQETVKTRRDIVLSFRTNAEVKNRIDREAKKRKLTRAEFIESLIIPVIEPVKQVA